MFVLLGALAGLVFVMAFYMQPLNGELTRMGGYLENDFGWNLPQEKFTKPLFKRAESLDEYDQYYDVVVLGDSFSEDLDRGWQNYLVAETGWSVISFYMNNVSLDELLEKQIYQNSPPKLFIYESIERNVIGRHSHCFNEDLQDTEEVQGVGLSMQLTESQIELDHRMRGRSVEQVLDLSPVFNYWRKSIARAVSVGETTEVHNFKLNATGLFSNHEDSRLLVITRDFILKGVTGEQVKTAQCSLLELQHRIQITGSTAFLALIFPDKTSVYSDYLDDENYQGMSIVSRIEETPGLNVVRLKSQFDTAIRSGVVDLYLPNDTHCGFYGYRLAANAVLDAISRIGWIKTE
jgi:hypothetical protein